MSEGAQLHDKATRRETLSPEEQARLDAWFAEQDAASAASLAEPAGPQTAAALRDEIAEAAAQLEAAARRIYELASGNATLRDEVAMLQRRLA
ncbi:MAG TPA: hypothetical protein VFL91_08380 [Thermomicrobiales bacterium]|nr:hypothetical protein [Thermomicrobiales bacterium]